MENLYIIIGEKNIGINKEKEKKAFNYGKNKGYVFNGEKVKYSNDYILLLRKDGKMVYSSSDEGHLNKYSPEFKKIIIK